MPHSIGADIRSGLNTVDLSTLNTAQQFICFFLIIIGSAIFVSSFVVLVRKNAFERRFDHIAQLRKTQRSGSSFRRRLSRSLSRTNTKDDRHLVTNLSGGPINNLMTAIGRTSDGAQAHYEEQATTVAKQLEEERGRRGSQKSISSDTVSPKQVTFEVLQRDDALERQKSHISESSNTILPGAAREIEPVNEPNSGTQATPASPSDAEKGAPLHITFEPGVNRPRSNNHFLPTHGVGARSTASIRRRNSSRPPSRDSALESASNHLPFPTSGYMSRNSQFSRLSEKERKKLGGYEYKAVRFLSWIVPAYFILFQLLGCLSLGAYVANNKASVALDNGLNPWWVGSFNAVSAFNNSGMSLLDANMVAFQTSIYMLLTMSLLILAGNTCYPIFLRLIVWTLLKLLPDNGEWEDYRKTLQFLLEHPRRCYTNMFPSQHTWWLLLAVIFLNGSDWVAFEVLNIGNKAIESLPPGIRVIDGLFQAFAVRSGGFYVVPISSIRIGLQVLYVIMMYISVYPVVITMRNTNIYEERSLGIYADDPDYVEEKDKSKRGYLARFLKSTPLDDTTQFFVRHQLRAQLSHDIWSVVVAIWVIMCIEAKNFERDPAVFSVFNVIFETVSAYGCVGISVGLPNRNYSFAGALHTASKLVLCAIMIRGRHRGLPVALDKAIMLPREEHAEAEEDDAMIRMERTISRGRAV